MTELTAVASTGRAHHIVTETMDDVIAQITRFRAGVLATAATLIAADEKNPAIAADAEAGL